MVELLFALPCWWPVQVPLMFPDELERQGGLVAVEQTAVAAAVDDGKH